MVHYLSFAILVFALTTNFILNVMYHFYLLDFLFAFLQPHC